MRLAEQGAEIANLTLRAAYARYRAQVADREA
jgi:hypothetical protein